MGTLSSYVTGDLGCLDSLKDDMYDAKKELENSLASMDEGEDENNKVAYNKAIDKLKKADELVGEAYSCLEDVQPEEPDDDEDDDDDSEEGGPDDEG